MTAEIIAVGTELLLGDIVNTNGQFLAQELAKLGISVYYQTTVGDNPERLKDAFKIAFDRADMVITTGGLGPTQDDLTKEIGAEFFGKEIVENSEAMAHLIKMFEKQNFTFTENNKKQAYFPQGSRILRNDHGTAPGCMIEENAKILIMMPGPPQEMTPMFTNVVLPILKEKSEITLVSRTLHICGVGESMVEDMLKDLIDAQTNPTIAPYAKTSEVALRITASGASEEAAYKCMEPVVGEIYNRLGKNIYGEDNTTLEKALIDLIQKRGLTLACAESCTGGLVTARLVNCPGASAVLKEGVVAYANESKVNRLGVSPQTLSEYGAVSVQTAEEMARGIAESSGADIGIATTGIAGPDGGTEEKPVGTVCIAMYIQGETVSQDLFFRGDRQKVRDRTVVVLLNTLRMALLGGKNG